MPLFFDQKRTLTGTSGANASSTGAVMERYSFIIGRTKTTRTVLGCGLLMIRRTTKTETVSGRCLLAIGRTGRIKTITRHYSLAFERTNTRWLIEI